MKKLIYILSILLIISLSLNIYYYNKGCSSGYKLEKEYITVQKRDTIVEYKYNTDTIYFNDIQYKTINVRDTVWIEAKNREYKDSTEDYDITINAVKLNNYQLNIHKRDSIQYENKIIRETVYKKHSPFSISLFAGPSYDFINNKFGVSVGVGVSFRLK